ncbi:hypothetical protein F2Q70_00027966 [Brassica cretica]|uniref:Uncharacterized protein n=1 Tax=Brassica cretica TaxID=69181 RepID=A0A8S9L8Z4_BRACR|nr:hypothetical protein F2Q70_00027966 [Brassica cretica]
MAEIVRNSSDQTDSDEFLTNQFVGIILSEKKYSSKFRQTFRRLSDDTEKRHSDELPMIFRCGHTRPEFIRKTIYRRSTFLGLYRRTESSENTDGLWFVGRYRRTMLSVLPAFPVTLWRLLYYYKPVYLQLPGKLLHLELKHLPRIYAHSVDNGVTWSVFLLRRNRSEPEAPLQDLNLARKSCWFGLGFQKTKTAPYIVPASESAPEIGSTNGLR